ncbi:unnamed protein product, partial [Sphagnum compactum]
ARKLVRSCRTRSGRQRGSHSYTAEGGSRRRASGRSDTHGRGSINGKHPRGRSSISGTIPTVVSCTAAAAGR